MFDILATTSNPEIIKGVYKDELPVTYNAPKPEKIMFTEDDLYHSDTFAFGSIIGSITNKSTSGYALMPIIEKKYGKDSEEYKILNSRLQQCCKAQSSQIDKTKIGREVKGIPKIWIEKQENEVYNHILLNKYPYFFRYLYKNADSSYKKYLEKYNKICNRCFGISITELESLPKKTTEQIKFLDNYYEYMPLIYSDSTMNLLCRYIESINFEISKKIKVKNNPDLYNIYKNLEFSYSKELYTKIKNIMNNYFSNKRCQSISNSIFDNDICILDSVDSLRAEFSNLKCDINSIVNCLIDYFYIEKPSSNKEILWELYGDILYQNVKNNTDSPIIFPLPDDSGDIIYMGKKYKYKEIDTFGL